MQLDLLSILIHFFKIGADQKTDFDKGDLLIEFGIDMCNFEVKESIFGGFVKTSLLVLMLLFYVK